MYYGVYTAFKASSEVWYTVELQGSAAPPISPIWTTVDPWKSSGSQQSQQPPTASVGAAAGLPAVMGVQGGGTPQQQYQHASTMHVMVAQPLGFPVHQAPVHGMSPFSGSPWPAPPHQQQVPPTVGYLLHVSVVI